MRWIQAKILYGGCVDQKMADAITSHRALEVSRYV
jgi:hypothetical protein